jgi:hypothetical protein
MVWVMVDGGENENDWRCLPDVICCVKFDCVAGVGLPNPHELCVAR